MDETLTVHSQQRAETTSWPPAPDTLPRFVTPMAVIPTPPQPKIE